MALVSCNVTWQHKYGAFLRHAALQTRAVSPDTAWLCALPDTKNHSNFYLRATVTRHAPLRDGTVICYKSGLSRNAAHPDRVVTHASGVAAGHTQSRVSTAMSKVCQVTGIGPRVGYNVSHANNKTKRRYLPNLHYHRFWVEGEKRFVRLRVSSKGLRIIDKKGIDAVLADLRARGQRI